MQRIRSDRATIILNAINSSPEGQVVCHAKNLKDSEMEFFVSKMLERDQVHKINTICLQRNHITDAGAAILHLACLKLSDIKFLDLQHNKIGINGAEKLLTLKAHFPQMILALHNNDLEYKDIVPIEQKIVSPK